MLKLFGINKKNQKIIFDTEGLLKKFCKNNKQYIYVKEHERLLLGKIAKKHGGYWVKFTFPKKIELTPRVVGLIIGEGYIDDRQFAFANSNERIIRLILEFLFQFKISPFFILEVATKNVNINFVEKSKKEWEKVLNKKIPRVRLRKEFKNLPKRGFTMRELKDIFGLKANPTDRINKMLSLNFVKKKKIKPKNKNPRYVYYLTNEYFKFINRLFKDTPFIKS